MLEDRHRDIRLTTLYQIINNKVYVRKDSLIPPTRLSRHMHNLSFQEPVPLLRTSNVIHLADMRHKEDLMDKRWKS